LKKIAAIAVLFVFLVNTMGYFVVFKYNQYLVKQEMISRIRTGILHPDVVILKILHPEQNQQFRRIEKNEFTFCGRLYDIVVERKTGDTTIFYCLHDNKEESLIADFTLYLRNRGRSGSSQKDDPMHSLLHNLVTQALIQNRTLPDKDHGVTFVFPVYQPRIIPVYLVHVAPPPEIA
jgi:hypothetical protein